MTIGIPRSFYYYYYGRMWEEFLKNLSVSFIVSPKTNRTIMDLGMNYSNDEMCLSLKNYIGHVAYLKDKCDMILVPRIDNYNVDNQTCTNFLATYDIVSNLFETDMLNYNINYEKNQTEEKAYYQLGKKLKKSKSQIRKAYQKAYEKTTLERYLQIRKNILNLNSSKIKILIISHPYNLYDDLLGNQILKIIKNEKAEIIYGDLFCSDKMNRLSSKLSNTLYFKYSKENIGAIEFCKEKIDGIIFLSSFPCGPDSLVNELVMRKIKIPYLNIVIDDLDGGAGVETRIESFVDILKEHKNV